VYQASELSLDTHRTKTHIYIRLELLLINLHLQHEKHINTSANDSFYFISTILQALLN